ncbi:MAG: hypothetical protein FGM27_00280 [Candidatus Omnitrophica bacterium]|nr:hypothetical protein [Candidatus Omnitrophota bacterium]
MSEQVRLSKLLRLSLLAVLLSAPLGGGLAQGALEIKAQETSYYQDLFEQAGYYEGTSFLRLDRLYRALFGKAAPAEDVNVYDEVPDSSFFTNRHSRSRLTSDQLKQGFRENQGPQISGAIQVVGGVFEGLQPVYEIKDSAGDRYLLRFDPSDSFELVTGAEVIASRFYYALGYNVPQMTIVSIPSGSLAAAPGAKVTDDTGFAKDLTQEKLEEYLLFLPTDDQGNYRASATKIITGQDKGSFDFLGKRRGDPQDAVDQERRRSLRALQVFSSWLNNTDVRPGTTEDVLVNENGQEVLKHYLVSFSSALGAASKGPKPPMHGHESLFDFREVAKAFLTLGLWEKPWQRRWREVGEKVSASPAVGYFDNRYFDPGQFKTQLQNYAFKDVTRADGFWAAKIIRTFSDEDLRALVEAGAYSNPADAQTLTKILADRRDILARHWFREANPLDNFESDGSVLTFKDLAVDEGFLPAEGTSYTFEVLAVENGRARSIASLESAQTNLRLDAAWFTSASQVHVLIRTRRPGMTQLSPVVRVELDAKSILGIVHEN